MYGHLPKKIPGLRRAMILLGIYIAIWIPLEGALFQVVLLAVWVTLVSLGYLLQERLGGRSFHWPVWLGGAAAAGLLAGLSSNLLTLFFMALKTGLHDHGPEFALAEIFWVLQRISTWTAAGLLAGLGIGLLTLQKESD